MLARTHFIIGLLTFLIMESYFEYKFLFFVSLFVASVLPDIDVKTSRVSKSLFPLGEVVRLFVKHRGMLHSLLLWFTVSLLFFPFFSVRLKKLFIVVIKLIDVFPCFLMIAPITLACVFSLTLFATIWIIRIKSYLGFILFARCTNHVSNTLRKIL